MESTGRLAGTTLFFFLEQPTEFGLGLGTGLGVLGGQRLGLGFGGDQRLGELVGLLALAIERSPFVVDVGDEGVQLVGVHVAGVERHLGELFTLEGVVEVLGVLEERAERRRSAADEGAQRHLAEVAPQLSQFGLLLGDAGFGVGDCNVELALGVDGVVVLLGDLQRSLFETFEFVDQVLDPLALLVDGLRLDGDRCHHRDQEGHADGDRNDAEESAEAAGTAGTHGDGPPCYRM